MTCHIGCLPHPPKRPPPLGLQFPRLVQPHVKPLPPRGQLFLRLAHTHPLSPGPRRGPPPLTRAPRPPSTRTLPDMMWVHDPSTATPGRRRTSSLIHGKRTRSARESTPTPPPSSRGTSPPTAPSHNVRMPRSPPLALPRARRIRAPSRPPKSCRQATVCLPPSHLNRCPRPREDFMLVGPRPPSTNKRP